MATKRLRSEIPIKEITFDEDIYPRSGYNWQTGYDYSQSMLAGATFPPIVLAKFKGNLYLIDGKHRLEATKLIKKNKIDAVIHVGWSRRMMFEEAIKSNISHGRVLSPYEKRMLALKLRELKYSNEKISELIMVPFDKIEGFVAQRLTNAITGEVITETVVKSGLKHLAGQTVVQDIESQQKSYYIRDQVSLLEQLINIIESGNLDVDNTDVSRLVKDLKQLLVKV